MKKLFALVAIAALVFAMAAPASAGTNALVQYDFESGIEGWTKTGWDAGDSVNFTAETDGALVGAGSLKMTMPNQASPTLGDSWQAFENTFNATEAANWDGIFIRVDATDYAAGYGNECWIVFTTNKFGAAAHYVTGVKILDLYGVEQTTDGSVDTQHRLPDAFNGWIFCPFEGNVSDTDLALQEKWLIGASDFYFKKDISNREMIVDEIGFYKGTDFSAVVSELGEDFLAAPTEAPTDEPTATPGDDTADVSILGYAVAAVVAGAAGLMVFKKK